MESFIYVFIYLGLISKTLHIISQHITIQTSTCLKYYYIFYIFYYYYYYYYYIFITDSRKFMLTMVAWH